MDSGQKYITVFKARRRKMSTIIMIALLMWVTFPCGHLLPDILVLAHK